MSGHFASLVDGPASELSSYVQRGLHDLAQCGILHPSACVAYGHTRGSTGRDQAAAMKPPGGGGCFGEAAPGSQFCAIRSKAQDPVNTFSPLASTLKRAFGLHSWLYKF